MTMNIRPVPDDAPEPESDVVATTEGDNEINPDQPLRPAADAAVTGLVDPRGAEPDDTYKRDHK